MAQTLSVPVIPSISGIGNTNPSNTFNSASSIIPKIGGLMSIRCAHVGGVQIPNNKKLMYSLQYIHGIGRTKAKKILIDLGMENKLTKDLSGYELATLRDEVYKYNIEGNLKRSIDDAIMRLKQIRSYRGSRHLDGLPCRGQGTKNNCRTLKGKIRVTIAGKKKPPR
ncbi:OLC1v1005039C2 [Oldenlandia corymbosa var. corymbosa]|nr:OLC1v1005039C2 [Oldenlandia corymbosa var. corymbosa]